MQILLKKCPLLTSKGESAVRNSILILLLIPFSETMRPGKNNNECLLWCLFGKDIEDRKDFEIKPMIKKVKSLKGLNIL